MLEYEGAVDDACARDRRRRHRTYTSLVGAGMSERRASYALVLFWVGFALLISVSMALYPGGTWLDRSAPGHHFFANFFCDLTQRVSLSGVTNQVGALCAQVGMLCFAIALAIFFQLLPKHFATPGRAPHVRRLGGAAVALFLLVTALPSGLIGDVHGWLALGSGALGVAAATLGALGLLASSPRARQLGYLGLATLVIGALDGVVFAFTMNGATPLFVPAAQKVAAVLLSVWMLGVARLTLESA